MNSLQKLLLISSLACWMTALPKFTLAFEFTYQDQIFAVEPEILDSWKGPGAVLKQNPLQTPADPKPALFAYLGLSLKPAAEIKTFSYRPEKIYQQLKTFTEQINVAKTEPVLEIQDGLAVNFTAPTAGRTLDLYSSTLTALNALEKHFPQADLTVHGNSPNQTLTEINHLGINELVATGESNFAGSPKNRVHNIKVGVGKMKGVIIAPGEEFSFNKFLGPVEEEQGFLPELVIKRTGTVPELGGGLCQVSSTTFRAAMRAGLPITQRKNHAYAVQYYSPQGTDATIYPGVVDLKFINDTSGHLLIWPYIKEKNKLIFEFYGTKDDRKVTLEKPSQYDRKEDGSLKAVWTRVVEKDGQSSTSTFKSVYLSPALFHKEEAFPTTSPQNGPQIPQNN